MPSQVATATWVASSPNFTGTTPAAMGSPSTTPAPLHRRPNRSEKKSNSFMIEELG
jgi:hypothetical protein